jgi:hypothetical protein
MRRPYVLLSCAMSVDGYIDDTTPERLLLSNAPDFDRVDQVRADSDAILIGATTMRRDNPRLLVNSETRRAQRAAQGLPPYLAIAPIFVDDAGAPRFVNSGDFPGGTGHRMTLAEARTVDDVVLLRYLPKQASGSTTS